MRAASSRRAPGTRSAPAKATRAARQVARIVCVLHHPGTVSRTRAYGVVALPAGFAPQGVAVELSPLGEGEVNERTVSTFPWDLTQS
jgi:hypothetical protein